MRKYTIAKGMAKVKNLVALVIAFVLVRPSVTTTLHATIWFRVTPFADRRRPTIFPKPFPKKYYT